MICRIIRHSHKWIEIKTKTGLWIKHENIKLTFKKIYSHSEYTCTYTLFKLNSFDPKGFRNYFPCTVYSCTWVDISIDAHLSTYTVGSPCIWMGVGVTIPFFFRPESMAFGNFISLKVLMGGGSSSPSTNMCRVFLTFSWYASDNFRIQRGGRHL